MHYPGFAIEHRYEATEIIPILSSFKPTVNSKFKQLQAFTIFILHSFNYNKKKVWIISALRQCSTSYLLNAASLQLIIGFGLGLIARSG